jgi:hypothetical protein
MKPRRLSIARLASPASPIEGAAPGTGPARKTVSAGPSSARQYISNAGKVVYGTDELFYVAGLSVVHRRAASAWLWHRPVISAVGCALVLATRPLGATATLAVGGVTLLAVAIYEGRLRGQAAAPPKVTSPRFGAQTARRALPTTTSASPTAVGRWFGQRRGRSIRQSQ